MPILEREGCLELKDIKTPELRADWLFYLSLATQLKSHYNKYSLVVGDDRRGRIPALVFAELIGLIHQKVPLIFLPGLRIEQQGKPAVDILRQELTKRSGFLPKKVRKLLFVTDHLAYGRTLSVFSELFKSCNISFDVAALGADANANSYKTKVPPNTRIFIGIIHEETSLNEEPALSGVCKTREGVIKRLFQAGLQPAINQTRQDCHTMSQFLYSRLT